MCENLFATAYYKAFCGKYCYKKRFQKINSETKVAEREGFEPPVPLSTAVFKTAVIDHSTISPWLLSVGVCAATSGRQGHIAE